LAGVIRIRPESVLHIDRVEILEPLILVDHRCSDIAVAFFLQPSGHHWDLHSFPTRRSSDLAAQLDRDRQGPGGRDGGEPSGGDRSEEHTSELQLPCNLVCRLLLEKKRNRPWSSSGLRASWERASPAKHSSYRRRGGVALCTR